jgi:hypothetical protein
MMPGHVGTNPPNRADVNTRRDFYRQTARRVLDELAVTDTRPTPKAIRMVLREEEIGRYLSEAEIMGVIATAMNLSKHNSSEGAPLE